MTSKYPKSPGLRASNDEPLRPLQPLPRVNSRYRVSTGVSTPLTAVSTPVCQHRSRCDQHLARRVLRTLLVVNFLERRAGEQPMHRRPRQDARTREQGRRGAESNRIEQGERKRARPELADIGE